MAMESMDLDAPHGPEPIIIGQALLIEFQNALGADIHERNRVSCNYTWCCKNGNREGVEKYETLMRKRVFEKRLAAIPGIEPNSARGSIR